MANVKVFEKWVKLQSQGYKVKKFGTNKGLVIRNTHMKCESLITYHSKDMANVKVFADRQAKNYMSPIFQYVGIKTKGPWATSLT
jgi:hypothetical protein